MPSTPSGSAAHRPGFARFAGLAVIVLLILISAAVLLSERSSEPGAFDFTEEAFDYPAFHLKVEDYAEGDYRMAFDLEWRSRNDWTERYIRRDGTLGLETKVVLGDTVTLYGMGPTHTYAAADDGVHVPGVWFRDVVATLPGPRETLIQNGSVTTIRRITPTDIEEWDGDTRTGIPLGYRQIVADRVVREFRVVSLVLADGTVIR